MLYSIPLPAQLTARKSSRVHVEFGRGASVCECVYAPQLSQLTALLCGVRGPSVAEEPTSYLPVYRSWRPYTYVCARVPIAAFR